MDSAEHTLDMNTKSALVMLKSKEPTFALALREALAKGYDKNVLTELPSALKNDFRGELSSRYASLLLECGRHLFEIRVVAIEIRDLLLDSPNPDKGITRETCGAILQRICILNRTAFRLWSYFVAVWDILVDVSMDADENAIEELNYRIHKTSI